MARLTLIFVLGYLTEWGIINDMKVHFNEDITSAVIFIEKTTKFTVEFLTLNRISRTNYHINCGDKHIRTKTAIDCAKEAKKLILLKKFKLKGE